MVSQYPQLMSLQDLISKVYGYLIDELKYAHWSVNKYRRVWKLLQADAEQKNVKHFSMVFACEFVKDTYGFQIGKASTERHRGVERAIHMLSDYQLNGLVFRRKQKKDEPWPEQFESMFKRFLTELETDGLAQGTLRQHRLHLHNFSKYLESRGLKNFSELSTSHIHGFIDTLAIYTKPTIAYALYALRKLFRFAYSRGYHSDDLSPICPTVHYSVKSNIPSAFSADEVQRLLRVIDTGGPTGKRDYAMILLISKLGLRVGDVRELKLDNIKWDTKTIELVQAKTGQLLILPLLDDIGWAIIDYLKHGRPQNHCPNVFLRHNAPFDKFSEHNNLHKVIKQYMHAANIEVPAGKRHGLHSLRHGLASVLLEQNTPLPIITEILGHLSSDTTSIYLKIDLNQLRQCALEVPYETCK